MASPSIDRLEALLKRLSESRLGRNWAAYAPVPLIVFGALLLYCAAPDMESPKSAVDVIPAPGSGEGSTEAPPEGYVSLAEQEFEARKNMIAAGLPGGKEAAEAEAEARMKAAGFTRGPGASSAGADARREREKRFLAEHRREMDQSVAKFDEVKRRYFKESPKVREIDAYFGRKNMPRFMALYDKYHKTDEFELWRQAFALPEFREGVRKYATDPEALKAGLRLLTDYSSKGPALNVVREGLFFAGTDEGVSGFLREHFWPKALPNLPGTLKASGIPPEAAAMASGLANVVSGGAGASSETSREGSGGKGGVPTEWQAKNTWKMDDNMKGAIMHGIEFYLLQQPAAKAVAESEKAGYHERLDKQ